MPGSGRSLEKEMTAHSSILAWKIPWSEKPVKPQSIGSQRVRLTGHTHTHTHTHTHIHTPAYGVQWMLNRCLLDGGMEGWMDGFICLHQPLTSTDQSTMEHLSWIDSRCQRLRCPLAFIFNFCSRIPVPLWNFAQVFHSFSDLVL